MHAMIALFGPDTNRGRGEMIAASDDPGVVAQTAALLAARGDHVAGRFLEDCVREATESWNLSPPLGLDGAEADR